MENHLILKNSPLKVLILEDSLLDLELMTGHLSAAGYQLEVTHTEVEAGFREALKNEKYDIILSDFMLPGFDAFGALEICQEFCPEVPFICVSGSIGEETAIDLLKKGAVDYVLKDRPARLPYAVQYALEKVKEKAALHKTAQELKESENRFRQVAEAAQEWIWEIDTKGLYTYASPVIALLLGYTPDEMVGKKYFYDFFIPEKREELKTAAFEVFAKRENFSDFENMLLHKNGQLVIALTNGSPVFDEDGNFKGYRGVDEDITERRQSEEIKKELLKRFELISLHLPGVIYQFRLRLDGSSHFPYASPGIYKIYGVQPKDVEQDATSAFKAIHPDDVEQVSLSINHSAQTLTPWHDIYRVNQPSGKTIWVEGNSTPQKLEDESIIWHGYIQDITERKIMEDTQAFLLQISNPGSDENFFESLAKYLGQCLNMEYVCIDLLEGDSLTAKTLAIYNEGNFDPNVSYALKDTPCGEVVENHICCYPQEVRSLFPNDAALEDIKAESYIGTTLWSFDGQPIGLIAVIGQKPLQNQELAASLLKLVSLRAAGKLEATLAEEKLKTSDRIFKHSMDMLCIAGFDGYFKVLNPAWTTILGWSDEELLSKPWIDIVHPNDRDKTKDIKAVIVDGKEVYQFENRYICKDGTIKWLSWNSFPYPQENVMFGVARDITERKKAEEALLAKMDELERFHKLTVGREITMVELKKEVNSLLNKLGLDNKYKIVE